MDRKRWRGIRLFLLLVLGLFCTACSGRTVGTGDSAAAGTSEETRVQTGSSGSKEESAGAEAPKEEAAETDTEKDADPSENGNASGGTAGAGRTEGEAATPSLMASIYGSYFKAGDFRYRLVITPGQPDQPDTIQINVETRDLVSVYKDWSNVMLTLQELTAPYEVTGSGVRLEDRSPLRFNLDGSITLADGTEAAGEYYSYEENLILPDVFRRPLNDTDLIGMTPEEMRLVRNECYAVYGRTFLSEDLQTYFESQPWYRKTVQPDAFSDDILGGMVKRNVEFLKEAEGACDPGSAKALAEAYEKLPESPCRYHLPNRGEVFVSLESAAGTAEDCGIYYKARGVIGIPLTFTVNQKRELDAGNAVEIDAAGLMGTASEWAAGSGAWLKKSDNSDYGEYVILRARDEKEEEGFYVEASYDAETGVYKLWQNSADTIFRNIYEGDIYVLKGASEEYYRYFDLPQNRSDEAVGKFRIMDFDEGEDSPYEGNRIAADGKGYIKGLYFYGD